MRLKVLGVFVVSALALFTMFYWLTDQPRREAIAQSREESLAEYGMELFGPNSVEVAVVLGADGYLAPDPAAPDDPAKYQPLDPPEVHLPVNGSIRFVNATGADLAITATGGQAFRVALKAEGEVIQVLLSDGESDVTADGVPGTLRMVVGPERLNPAAANCAQCHGADGTGGPPTAQVQGPNLHSTRIWDKVKVNDNYVNLVIRFGGVVVSGNVNSPMPAWSTEVGGPLNEAQIEALEALVRSWAEAAASAAPSGTPVPNTVEAGQQVFTDAGCVSCHAADLSGGVGPNLQTIGVEPVTDLPFPITQLAKLQADYAADPATFLASWIRDSWGNYNDGQTTQMPQYPPEVLRDDQLQALITFLLAQGR